MTEYQPGRFTASDAEALTGAVADITEWDGDEHERKITYPGAEVIGVVYGRILNIRTAGAVVTDVDTGEHLAAQGPEEDWNVFFSGICEVSNVRPAPARKGGA